MTYHLITYRGKINNGGGVTEEVTELVYAEGAFPERKSIEQSAAINNINKPAIIFHKELSKEQAEAFAPDLKKVFNVEDRIDPIAKVVVRPSSVPTEEPKKVSRRRRKKGDK